MNPWTCTKVEEQIDLYAAGESDAAARQAIEQHVQDCRACAELCREARRLQGLLGLHFQAEGRLPQLLSRLEAELHKVPLKKARLTAFARTAAALAAMLLVVVGLFQWLGPDHSPGQGSLFARALDPRGWDVPSRKEMADNWSRTVLEADASDPETKRVVRGNPDKRAQPGVPEAAHFAMRTEVTVWAAPGTRWKVLTPRQVELHSGRLLVDIPRSPDWTPPFEVSTPAGVATARGAKLVIQFRPASVPTGPKENQAQAVVKPRVYVTVVDGQVQFANPRGAVAGSGGERLWAAENSAPREIKSKR
jgi:hypothetical protein